MATLIKHVRIIDPRAGMDVNEDVLITKEGIFIAPNKVPNGSEEFDGQQRVLIPGLVDLHVHFREPGFVHKEDIASGIRAALAGGVTSALVMPNTRPAIDSPQSVLYQLRQARRFGFDMMVAGAATYGLAGEQRSDVGALKRSGAKAITDDGRPILSDECMAAVLKACRVHNLVCMQHAEHTGLSCGHPINQGIASARLKIPGQEARAEYDLIERDLKLAERIGTRYHVLHLSCKESLKLVRRAKERRIAVTCEVAPHHLLLSDNDIRELDGNMKMNPPLRSKADRDALIEGINDGSIDAVASDHAPHHRREKMRSFVEAPFGVVGVETSMLVLLRLVQERKIELHSAIRLMTHGPAQVIGEDGRVGTIMGEKALKNAVFIDPHHRFQLTEKHLFGRSKNSAFLGRELGGRILATFLNGNVVYRARGI